MANPIIRGFSKLTQFSGRDTRGEFWPYVGIVVALVFLVQAMGMSWVMADLIGKAQAYTDAQPVLLIDPDLPPDTPVRIEAEPPPLPPPPTPDFRILGGVMGVTVVLAISLLAAAVSRRLHDRNMTALWGLTPVPFLGIAAIGFPIMMTDMMASETPNLGLFGLLVLNNALYMVALVTLIIILAQRGAPGPNRHGETTLAPEPQPVSDWGRPD